MGIFSEGIFWNPRKDPQWLILQVLLQYSILCTVGYSLYMLYFCREREGSKRHIYTLSRFTIPDKTAVKSLSCGKEHVLLLTVDGNVLSFGSGSRGQLGLGSLESRDSPTVLEVLQPLHITMISAGGWHSVALSSKLSFITFSSYTEQSCIFARLFYVECRAFFNLQT